MDAATLRALFAALRETQLFAPAQLRDAEAAVEETNGDPAALAEKWFALGLLTNYQFQKIRSGKVGDIHFGRYLVADKIGEGGMGKVFRAVEPGGRIVALKTIRPHLMSNATVLKRYQREARAVAAVDHPNVVKLYDADVVAGRFTMAMEYVDGVDLSRMVKLFGQPPHRGLDDVGEICEYGRQAALGLQAAHDGGFVHRDIKPSNLLVCGERALTGTGGKALLKILDMGLVRSISETDDASKTDLTRDGTVVGTPDYMAPEQAKNSSTVDHRADLYALGATLYFLLRGQAPFPEGSPIDKLIRHQLDPAPPLAPARPDAPAALIDLVERLLRKKPEERPQRAADVAVLLEKLRDGVPVEVGPGGFCPPVSLEPEPIDLSPHTPPGGVLGGSSAENAASSPTNPSGAGVTVGASAATASTTSAQAQAKAPAPRPRPEPPPSPARRSGTSGPASGVASRTPAPTAVPPPRPAHPEVVKLPAPPPPKSVVVPKPTPTTGPKSAITRAGPPSSRIRRPHDHKHPHGHGKGKRSRGRAGWYALAAALALAVLLGAVAFSDRGGAAPATDDAKPAAPTTPVAPPAPPPAPRAAAASALLPGNAVGAAVLHPAALWRKGAFQWRAGTPAGEWLAALAKRTKFDPRTAGRLTVVWTGPDRAAAVVGEGGSLTPEVLAGLPAAEWPQLPSPTTSGRPAKAFRFERGAPPASPRLGAVLDGRYYLLTDEPAALTDVARRVGAGPLPLARPDAELAEAVDAGSGPDGPTFAFAAGPRFALTAGGETLEQEGVRSLSVTLTLKETAELSLVIVADDRAKVREFISRVVALELAEAYPPFRKLAGQLARKASETPVLEGAGGKRSLRVTMLVPLPDLLTALGQLAE